MQYSVVILSCAALLSGAFFLSGIEQTIALVLLMLLAPFSDKNRRLCLLYNTKSIGIYLVLLLLCLVLVITADIEKRTVVNQFMLVALPEEFFFRAYLMGVLGMNIKGNMLASGVFSLLHALTRGWLIGVLVFIPSMLFGYIYQRYKDLSIVVLVHFLSNIVFFAILMQWEFLAQLLE